ncbi:MAG: biotin--[acetyl-CoA-carboxylase] ligase [Propionibacteriaceae bacterium]|jgi:BirA family biotin operon repressor/biotin-[acetyl-CoA-carboxylase] ligase|nr:biotin--[acetyl-CoA-carboxylase] ligase [Propionibacteriaceae bacterium]
MRWNITWKETTGSTNQDLLDAARTGVGEGEVVVSEYQSGGRGRFDRSWVAPPKATLATSLLLTPKTPIRRWPWLPLLTGVAVADTVAELGLAPELKWPNDVMLGGKKLCGILVEVEHLASGPAAVVGIGLNTAMTSDELPVPTATSLAIAGAKFDEHELVDSMLSHLGGYYEQWVSGADVRPAYLNRCATIGREVRVIVTETESYEGTAEGIGENGELIVRVDGHPMTFTAADVLHLR